jgi:hypothetical protein
MAILPPIHDASAGRVDCERNPALGCFITRLVTTPAPHDRGDRFVCIGTQVLDLGRPAFVLMTAKNDQHRSACTGSTSGE